VSVPTAELTAPRFGADRKTSSSLLALRLSGGRLYLALGAAALTIAALSLLVPSTPSYDPWSWLMWGREIVHLDLHTNGGPTWKPLPVVFTTVLALFGKAAPDLWLVVARAGSLMALAMVFKMTMRITYGLTRGDERVPSRLALVPTVLAALLAAGSLVASRGFISDNALGYSEGLMTAIVLIAIDSHLDGKCRQAFIVGFFAALDRPELWLAWGPYGLYLWLTDRGARKLVIGLFALIPVFWFLPEYWGSGHFFRGVNRAHHPRSNSPAFSSCPFCTELGKHAWRTTLLRVKVVAGIAMAVAAVLLLRSGSLAFWRRPLTETQRARLILVGIGAAGLAWWVLIALLTQLGFSGNDRYLVLGAALIGIAGGAGWGWAGAALGGLLARAAARVRTIRPRAAGAVGSLVVAAVFMALPPWIGANVVDIQATHRALVYQAHLRADLATAVGQAGGSTRVLRCGSVMTEGFQVPMVSWRLGVPFGRVQPSPNKGDPLPPPPNVIFQARAQHHAHLLPFVRTWTGAHYRLVAHVRTFHVYETDCRA
jgi:hypothetical protein